MPRERSTTDLPARFTIVERHWLKELFLAALQNFFFFDNDVYIELYYSDMIRELLPLYPSGTLNAAAPDGAPPRQIGD
jgi:hypothetical protein